MTNREMILHDLETLTGQEEKFYRETENAIWILCLQYGDLYLNIEFKTIFEYRLEQYIKKHCMPKDLEKWLNEDVRE